jgi:hypothetical protein
MGTWLLIPGIYLGLWLGVIFHEGGHFICARAGGLGIRLVRAGVGPGLLARVETEIGKKISTIFALHAGKSE